ncbi:hypothetical protein, partial [Thalassospira sp.]|uniref:hypothetical protein n=1 Tax=Thalassospira sp. TaxID=1912094 RepID=UPI000E918A6E
NATQQIFVIIDKNDGRFEGVNVVHICKAFPMKQDAIPQCSTQPIARYMQDPMAGRDFKTSPYGD